ncbi:hypothetical protein GUJ93_ZPchr0015g6759 [Zizania palustris]|uniref:Uncharacterized protein n=1 Tax=Zizania palustris TaxID=103762 RepID=A0A8J5W0Z4_ZIZPA|nr:hypothetical protein GUJ93_ZPchr0015g6759 [Zizania palustris]
MATAEATPKDKKASLVIHGLVDKVIAGIMYMMNLCIPPYIRTDFIQLSLRHSVKKKCVRWTLRVTSIHGLLAPLSFLGSVEVSFPERPDMKSVVLKEQPFSLQSDGYACSSSSIEWPVDFLRVEPRRSRVPQLCGRKKGDEEAEKRDEKIR